MPNPSVPSRMPAGAFRTAVEPPRIHDAQPGPTAQLGESGRQPGPPITPGSGGTGLRDGHHRRGPLVGPIARAEGGGGPSMPYRISRLGLVEVRSLDLDRDLDYYLNVAGAPSHGSGG